MQQAHTHRKSASLANRHEAGSAPCRVCGDTSVPPVLEKTKLSAAPSRRPDDLVRLLKQIDADETLADEIVEEVTVGETYFFRDPAQFDAIRNTVLPSLLCRRPEGRPLRIWSAGCSTGEEAYSLAILMEEQGLAGRADILATDISRNALRRAAEARYGNWSLRGAAVRMRPYLVRRGGRMQIKERFRLGVRFARLALGDESLPSPERGIADLDLILCRNVLIYLPARAVRRVARQLHACLAPGGWLLTAPSDPPLWNHAPFLTVTSPAGVLYRRAAPAVAGEKPAQRDTPALPVPAPCAVATRKSCAAQDDRLSARSSSTSSSPGERVLTRRVRSLWKKGATAATRTRAAEALERYPLSVELRYLQARALAAEGRLTAAVAALRRLLYLDRTLPAAHFLLGRCLRQSDPDAALRAFETAFTQCAHRRPQESVRLIDGVSAGQLAMRIGHEIGKLKRHAERF